VVGHQPYAPAAFTQEEIPGTHFQRPIRPQGTWFCRGEPRKKSPVIPTGIDSRTVRLVTQCLNQYATPGPAGLACTVHYIKIKYCDTYIQSVSRLVGITAGGDFLGLCDQKSSYKHVSDFGRLRSYDHLKRRIEGNDY